MLTDDTRRKEDDEQMMEDIPPTMSSAAASEERLQQVDEEAIVLQAERWKQAELASERWARMADGSRKRRAMAPLSSALTRRQQSVSGRVVWSLSVLWSRPRPCG